VPAGKFKVLGSDSGTAAGGGSALVLASPFFTGVALVFSSGQGGSSSLFAASGLGVTEPPSPILR
jgi:hypothetical protein